MAQEFSRTGALSAAALALLLGGCETLEAGPPPELVGPVWIAEAIGGAALPNQPPVTLQFAADGNVAGNAACNQYSGPYDIGEPAASDSATADMDDVIGPISFGALVSTKMACEEPAMGIEQAYFAALDKVVRYEIRNRSELLLLAADDSRIRFRREDAEP